MKHVLLQIGKHSSVYMFAQILTSSVGVLMLPIYLHYFTPTDFGCMTLVELSGALLYAVLVNGTLSALSRFHFEANTDAEQQVVWWTGFLFVLALTTVGSAAYFVSAPQLSQLMFGPEITRGTLWIQLNALILWIDSQNMVVWIYLRMRKQSTLILWQSVCHSWTIAVCAMAGIVWWNAGPTAVFAAIIVASSGLLLVRYLHIARAWGRPRYSRQILSELWSYGWPVIINGLLMNVMYQISRWFVKELLTLEQVGLMSLGLQIADKVNRMIVMPFQGIWTTLIYELHSEHPGHAVRTYCVVYELFCYVLISVFFGCSIVAGPALTIIARPEYLPSVPLIPILCLAQFCLAAGDQFQTPMRLSKQSYLLIPSAVMGVLMAWLMNSRLIPIFGVYGAAWATVATYAVFTAVSLLVSRQIEIYPYPFHRIGLMLAGVCATYFVFQAFAARIESGWVSLGIGLGAWCGWTLAMAFISYWNLNRSQPDAA